jgi:hypothetical protein
MATVSGSFNINTSFVQTLTGIPGAVAVAIPVNQSAQIQLAAGTIVDAIDLKYSKTLTLAAAALTIDLTTLLDVAGNVVNFAKIKTILIYNKSQTTDLLVGNAASNPWVGFCSSGVATITVGRSTLANKGVFALVAPGLAGLPVSGTSKAIKLDPGAATFDIDIEITGTSV